MDYGVQLNRLFYQKAVKKEHINLFCPNDVPELYEAFFRSNDEFEALYEQYSNDSSINKKTVSGWDLLMSIVQERASTGRIYIQNVDHCNEQGPFIADVAPIKQSNLCLEVALPTAPLMENKPDEGEIALCTLAAFNLGVVTLEELPELADIIVRAIDALFDYQEYPVKAAEKAKYRRSIGIGVIGYAHWLAKQGFSYSGKEGDVATHELFEAIQYYLLNASAELAGEKGACEYFDQTEYSRGKLPIDWYNKNVDNLCNADLKQDWEALREKIAEYGLRNSTLTAIMPAETSALVSGETNGIEPVRALTASKGGKDSQFKTVAPDVQELFEQYEKVWDMPSNEGYLNKVAIMQKFVDQAISANTNYDPSKFDNNLVPMKVILMDILNAYKNGVKTLYYHNTRDASGEDVFKEDDCSSGACRI